MAVATPLILLVVAGLVLAFTAPSAPPLISAIQNSSNTMGRYAAEQPSPHFLKARDGTRLSYRIYPGKMGMGVVVAVHGSSGSTAAMHGVADTLSKRGITVYSIDLRGHGLSPGPGGKLGDVAYRGQYEDDLADVAAFVRKANPEERLLLLGHSTGGSVILRTASLARYAKNFDAYLALSPFIAPGGPMDRPNQGGWTSVSVPRIVVLSILNGFGISALDHMTVLAMAVPPNDDLRPRSYSHALLASANLPRDWKPSVAAIEAPTKILIGSEDELFIAKAYPSQIRSANPHIAVHVLPGITHMGIISDENALDRVTAATQRMLRQGEKGCIDALKLGDTRCFH
ncbi:alpha/beta hydrolase [Sphingorhabdus pulchriflava]|uniref:Alpha/beta hydrolase n=2 Tax=Sphingorhabdus pulchriflava TaxID=2292257 RepID=A0A371BI29_9SPHN|nr:alpha/beta hydrolase [Sphingorhabdus pulchriflava]